MAAGKLVHKPKHTSNNQSIQEQNRTAGTQVSRKSRATGEDVTDPTPKPSQDSDTARWQRSCPGCFIFIVQWKRRHVVHLYIPDELELLSLHHLDDPVSSPTRLAATFTFR